MWFVAIAVITWSYVKGRSKAPPAAAFVGTGIVYPIAASITALPFASAGLLGGAFAVGWTLNLIYLAAASGSGAPQGADTKQTQGQADGSNVVPLQKPHHPPGQIQGGTR